LYVGSLPQTFTDEQLRAMFEPFTKVTFATVLLDQLTVRARCTAWARTLEKGVAQATGAVFVCVCARVCV